MDGVEDEVLARPLDETHPSLAGLTRLRGDALEAAVVGRTLAAVPREGLPQSETFRRGGEVGVQLDRVEVRGRYRAEIKVRKGFLLVRQEARSDQVHLGGMSASE